jgi:hypothetical protein
VIYNHVMSNVVQLMENLHLGHNGHHVRQSVVQEYENDFDHVQVHHHHVKESRVLNAQWIQKYAIQNHVVSK